MFNATGSVNDIQQYRTALRQIVIAGERNIERDIPNGQVPPQLAGA